MQSLWSRAAQAQFSCRCRACLHATNTITRRSTTAASRRKVTAADLFTACYTTILGTATVLDARRKEARRKELDAKLEKARAALSTLPGQESRSQHGGQHDGIETGPSNGPAYPTPLSSWRGQEASSTLLQELGHLCDITHRPLARPSWVQVQVDWVKIEAAIAAEERDPNCILREPKTDDHLGRTTTQIEELVGQLLSRSQTQNGTRNRDKAGIDGVDTEAEDALWKEVEDVRRSPHYPSYEYPERDIRNTARTRSMLSESIRRIFNQATSSKKVVGKICYNLLTSSAPPSMHTYNTLIAGFNRIQRPDLAQAVIDSYILNTAWPATQQTMVCLLNHYRGTNELEGMRDTIQRMRGVKDTGLNVRIFAKQLVHSDGFLKWASKNCASRKHAFVQRVHRGDDVFDSLIKCWLHYGQVCNAAMMFVACMRQGAMVQAETLHDLFRACLATVDVASARKLLIGIAKNFRGFAAIVNSIMRRSSTATSRMVVGSLSHLLEICWLPYDELYGLVGNTYRAATQELKLLVKRMQLQIEVQETTQLCMSTVKGLSNPGGSFVNRLDRAIADLEAVQQMRRKDSEAMIGFDRLAGLLSIDRRYRDLKDNIEAITAMAHALVIKMKTGYDFDTSSILTPERHRRPVGQSRYEAPELSHRVLRRALGHIELRSGPMTEGDVKNQLLQRIPNAAGLVKRLENSGNSEDMPMRVLASFYLPGSVDLPEPEDQGHNVGIRKLEEAVGNAEDDIRATLFVNLSSQTQHELRSQYPEWYRMPVEKVAEKLVCKLVDRMKHRDLGQQATLLEAAERQDLDKGAELPPSTYMPPLVLPATRREDIVLADGTARYAHPGTELRAPKPVALSCLPRPTNTPSDESMSLHFAALG
ncbi:Uu.00g077340.m01.CDS01 [Anthostomella pinea]|uniref:Uu.00g077340.m01.CDS01 n=1 Tax=Anthostomella pinea TaxID=933095 RepID=A0AAI8YP74_9PEZI|nr:Uu.00g077340.m01.CDS01 [Anthostomella pinea]